MAELFDLDWDHVRVFLAVARAGQLSGAAERLGLDLSTVSRRLTRIEGALGLDLFERSKDGTTLTAAAEAMIPAAEEAERALADFLGAANAAETVAEGVVRLSVPPGVAEVFVAPLLARFFTAHPQVRVELIASVAYADLTRREADLAIRTTMPKSGDLVVKKLVTTRALPMASPGYAQQLGALQRLEDARWIGWDRELEHIPVARWLAAHGPGVTPVLRTSHFASQIAAAEAGLGVALMPEPFQFVRPLVAVPPGRALKRAAWAALPEESLFLVGHRALRRVPRVAVLWDFLVELMAQPERAREVLGLAEPTASAPRTPRRGARRR
ncbi:MAG: LysR family transcriptional regulator [Myxococcales bacterium]|nr:LysR family transcriptional regulator [Myxococcales bacterium]